MDGEGATVDGQINGVDKIGFVRSEKDRRLSDIHRDATPTGEILHKTVFRNLILANRRTESVWRNGVHAKPLGSELNHNGAGEVEDTHIGTGRARSPSSTHM